MSINVFFWAELVLLANSFIGLEINYKSYKNKIGIEKHY